MQPKYHLFQQSSLGLNTCALCSWAYPQNLRAEMAYNSLDLCVYIVVTPRKSSPAVKKSNTISLFSFHFAFYQKKRTETKKKHWRCLHHRQESSIFCCEQFCHEQNEPHTHPSPGANSSIHSILYIPIVPVQSFSLYIIIKVVSIALKYIQCSFIVIIITILIVRTVSFPTVRVWWDLCASFRPCWYKVFRRHDTSVWFVRTKIEIKHFPSRCRRGPHTVKAIRNAYYNKLYSPKSTAFIYVFPLLDVNKILNPSQTLQGALLPTATSAPIWDYMRHSQRISLIPN